MLSEDFANFNRRKEPRHPAKGKVRLVPHGMALIEGRLVDVAASGFRARHSCQALTSGQEVSFARRGARGRARVMWTRIAGGTVESGFLVLPGDER
jgi:hypothetical protein